jgi:ribosomal protein S18 acetylase RimI-like enzyme
MSPEQWEKAKKTFGYNDEQLLARVADERADVAKLDEVARKIEGKDLGNGLTLKRTWTEGSSTSFDAYSGNKKAGTFTLDITNPMGKRQYSMHAGVEPAYQRQGIATKVYDAIEDALGAKLTPSGTLTAEGRALWNSRQSAPPKPN